MGLLSRMLGHATEADIGSVEETLEHALAGDEKIEKAFQLMRDLIIFTNRRMILVDRQGITGRKTEYHSVPYRAITHFSVESAGTFDLEAELKIWISGSPHPIQKTFKRGQTIFDVQKALATFVGR
ncbi:MAG TPA: PH domain-containing protein [Vicinamibacterales bacterium]|nr:PH domain-containing protein [Vicinamibacterales bacterium]